MLDPLIQSGVFAGTCTTAGISCAKKSTLSVVAYVLIGLIGLPVFSNFSGGAHVIAGVTGGFIIGYIPCAFIVGLVSSKTKSKIYYILATILATLILYVFGVGYYMLAYKVTFEVAISTCVLPFIVFDVIKIALATLLYAILKPKLNKLL